MYVNLLLGTPKIPQKTFVNHNRGTLICALKMNEGIPGLEQHEGDSLMTELKFLCELSL